MDKEKLRCLKEAGLKLTPQRIAILDYLENNTTHPSAEDVYNALKDRFPSMSFATVYNTLKVLVEKGMLLELNIDNTKKRFDPFTHPHHHFICKNCGYIHDVNSSFEIFVPDELKDFEVNNFQVVFVGLCPKCKS